MLTLCLWWHKGSKTCPEAIQTSHMWWLPKCRRRWHVWCCEFLFYPRLSFFKNLGKLIPASLSADDSPVSDDNAAGNLYFNTTSSDVIWWWACLWHQMLKSRECFLSGWEHGTWQISYVLAWDSCHHPKWRHRINLKSLKLDEDLDANILAIRVWYDASVLSSSRIQVYPKMNQQSLGQPSPHHLATTPRVNLYHLHLSQYRVPFWVLNLIKEVISRDRDLLDGFPSRPAIPQVATFKRAMPAINTS